MWRPTIYIRPLKYLGLIILLCLLLWAVWCICSWARKPADSCSQNLTDKVVYQVCPNCNDKSTYKSTDLEKKLGSEYDLHYSFGATLHEKLMALARFVEEKLESINSRARRTEL